MQKVNVNNFSVLEQLCGEDKALDLVNYLESVLTINEQINLTSIKDFSDACLLHLEDSLVALPEINSAIDGKYCDIGCGGGFPGVPIGVATGRETYLIDSRAKKIKAVQTCIEASNVNKYTFFDCVAERIEDFSKMHDSEFAVVSARALSSLPSLLELASPLLKIGGTFVAYKSKLDAEEELAGVNLLDKLGFVLSSKRELTLSDEDTNRFIYSFKKIKQSKIKLPRKVGLAQKKPLTNF